MDPESKFRSDLQYYCNSVVQSGKYTPMNMYRGD